MSVKSELDLVNAIVGRTMDNLVAFTGMSGRAGSELRYAAGLMKANTPAYLGDGSFAYRFMTTFRLATAAGITLDGMDRVLQQLTTEIPDALPSTSIVQNGLVFAIAQDARIIRATDYASRDAVNVTMQRMQAWFVIIKDLIADTMSGPGYEAFVTLAAAITRYLTDVARPLPRLIAVQLAPLPALAVSQRIYGDGSRSEELVAENQIVHPAFMRRDLRALSA